MSEYQAGQVLTAAELNESFDEKVDSTDANITGGQIEGVDHIYVVGTTDSIGPGYGALTVAGGVGIAKKLQVGQSITAGGAITTTAATVSSSTTTGALVITGGAGIGGNINAGGSVAAAGGVSAAGQMAANAATASTSTTTGALVVVGGVGVGGAVNVGGNLTVGGATTQTGALNISSSTGSTSTSTGALTVGGGVGIAQNINIGGTANIAGVATVTSATASTNASTGALVVTGGVGIGGALNITGGVTGAGSVRWTNTTDATSTTTGAVAVSGGIGIAKNAYVGSALNVAGASTLQGATSVTNTTASTSTTTGALVVTGGVGIGGAVNVGGATTINGVAVVNNSTASTSPITGALTVAGGVGITGALWVSGLANISGTATFGGNTTLNSVTASTSKTTGALVVAGGVGIGGALNVGGNANVTGTLTVGSFAIPSLDNTPIGQTTPAAGSFTTVSATTSYTFPDGTKQYTAAPGKNRIINGSAIIVQTGPVTAASAAGVGSGGYGGPDMFSCTSYAGGSVTQSASTLVYGGVTLPCVKQTCNAVMTNNGGGYYWSGFRYMMEGFSVYDLAGQPITLSFIFSASLVGVYTVAIRDAAATYSYITTITVATANTPTRYVVTTPAIPAGASLGGATANTGMQIWIGALSAGTYLTSSTGWVNGNYITHNSASNWGLTAGATISLTRLQLEAGTVATAFEFRPLEQEYALCRRYLQVWTGAMYIVPANAGDTYRWGSMNYSVPMRVTPALSVSLQQFGANIFSNNQFGFQLNVSQGDTTTTNYITAFTADARL